MAWNAIFILLLLAATSFASTLRLCHTNDFHAKYLEVGDSNVKCKWSQSVANQCYSGVARLATAFDQLACDVRIQAGDWVQGSLLDTIFKQKISIEAYHWVNYDFAVFGNHEFDYGNGLINDTIRQISPRTTWISSNVFFDGQGMDDLPLHRWVDRHDICWVSTLTRETLVLSHTEDNVRIENEHTNLRKYIRRCAQQKNVVAITHQGYNNDVKTCRQVKEIDLIIGGHSHTNLDNGQYPTKVTRSDGSVCWVTQAFAHGRYVGVMDVQFDEEGAIKLKSTAYVPMDYRVKRDPEVLLKVEMFNAQVAKKAATVVGEATALVTGGKMCRGPASVPPDGSPVMGDCAMADLVCDAVLDHMKGSEDAARPHVCLMNGGTVRNSFAKGKITIRDVINVLPFGNTLVLMNIKGADIEAALLHGFSVYGTDNKGGFPGGVGNIRVKATVDGTADPGEMVDIEEVTVAGEPLVADKDYVMLTNGYIADGGDGYSWPVEFTDTGTMLREMLQTYLEKNNPYTPISEDEARVIMAGSSTEELNIRTSAADEKYVAEAIKFVDDDESTVETELDDAIVIPGKPLPPNETCVGEQCAA